MKAMLSKNQIKSLRSLRRKKSRHEHRQFLVEGETSVAEVLSAMPPELRQVLCTPDYRDSLSRRDSQRLGDKLVVCEQGILNSISALDSPSPVLALLDIPDRSGGAAAIRGLGLYLDGIRDPGNLGTILRVADWFGVESVWLADDCVDLYNPKTIQASMGSFLRVRAGTASLASIRQSQPELEIVGSCIDGEFSSLEFLWPADAMLVIGSESHGIRGELAATISKWISVPRGKPNVGAESLNAAVATGILCASYLARRS